MQYALTNLENYQFIIDVNEIYAFESGLAKLNDIQPEPDTDKNMPLQLVYGVYKPQPYFKFPRSEVRRHILESMNHWLIHIDKLNTVYLGIEEIELIDVTLTTSCDHSPKPHASSDIAFAALMRIPDNIKLGNGKSQAKTAYLQWFEMDALTTLINRKGLFSLILPEKRIYQPLTSENWKGFIDYTRAVKYAQRSR